jgi:transposase-like protein
VSETRVNLARARELLAERGDRVGQPTLSRYVSKYADALDPQRDGRELTVDFETLAKHRAENINRASSAPSSSPASVSISKGRAHEASLNIRAQRQMRELEIAERIGALTPTREVRAAAAEAVAALRNAFALSLNDSTAALAHAFNIEPRLVRPYLKTFEKNGLDAFARALIEKGLVAELEPDDA